MPLTDYLKIKDKLCLYYEGNSQEYIVQLRALRQSFETEFPGIKIVYACKKEYLPWLHDDPNAITLEEYQACDYACRIRILYDASSKVHPILNLIKESLVPVKKTPSHNSHNHLGVVCPEGDYPTHSLTSQQLDSLKHWMQKKGFKSNVVGTAVNETNLPIDCRPGIKKKMELARSTGLVAGVECDLLYEAAASGTPTALVPTGAGEELYKLFTDKPIIINI